MHRDFPVSNAGISQAFDFISNQIKDQGQDEVIAHRLCVILDEVCSNMIRHDDTLDDTSFFSLSLCVGTARAVMTLRDQGLPFDPLAHDPQSVPEIGGQGINLIKGLASEISYERAGKDNLLTVEVLAE